MLRALVRKVRKSWKHRGVIGTARTGLGAVRALIAGLSPERRRARRRRRASDEEFDREHGVDTGGIIGLERLEIGSRNSDFGIRYQPIHRVDFGTILGPMALDYEKYTFIDFGSGKGRALLLASELPFRKIVGVEFSPELHEIARRNVAAYRSDRQRCRDFNLLCADAATYTLPEGPAVLYFYHPFGREVMGPVIENVARSLRDDPRDLVILYFNPMLADMWDAAGFLAGESSDDLKVYRSRDDSKVESPAPR